MKIFLVRIELHGAENKDYQQLHEAMKAQGFSRTISVLEEGKSITKELLRGEYSYTAYLGGIEDIMRLATDAVVITLRDNLPAIQHLNTEPTIVVSEVVGMRVSGLKSPTRTFSFKRAGR